MWRLLAKAAISIALIWLLVRRRDLDFILRQMLAVERGKLIGAALILESLAVLMAFRWSAILAKLGHPMGVRLTFPIVMIGTFFNNTLPSSIGGDAMRMWLANRFGIPVRTAVTSVIIDRLTAFAALLILVACMLPASFRLIAETGARIGLALLLVAGFGGFALAMLLDRLPGIFYRLKPMRSVAQFASELRAVSRAPATAALVLMLSLATLILMAVAVWLIGLGLDMTVGLTQCVMVVPLAILATTLPISIAGWGVREGAFVAGFALVGLGSTEALELSLLFGVLVVLVSLPGGIIWLVMGRRERDLSGIVRPAAPPGGLGTP